MTDASTYSEDPYQDGTVPADADFATSGADGASAEEPLDSDAPRGEGDESAGRHE